MKLKNRIILFVTQSVLITVLAVIITFFLFSIDIYSDFEDTDSRHLYKLTNIAIEEEIIYFEKLVADWAAWDDMYDFLNTNSTEFINSNFHKNTFENLEINTIFILNEDKEIFFEKHFDYLIHEEKTLTDIEKNQILTKIKTNFNNQTHSGITKINDEIYLFGAHKITNTDKSEGSDYYLIFSKKFKEELEHKLTEHIIYDYVQTFTITTTNTIDLQSAEFENLKKIDENIYKENLNYKQFKLFINLQNYLNEDIGIIELEIKKVAFLSGITLFFLVVIVQILIISLIGVIFYSMMDKYILHSIITKNDTIKELIKNDELDKKLEQDSDLELNELSESFNILIKKINEHKQELLLKNSELSNKNIELKKLDNLKNEFLSKISHELKTPLTAIKSFSQLLNDEMSGNLDAEQQSILKIIIQATDELHALINDLFDLSCFEKKKITLNKTNCSLKDIVSQTIMEFDEQIKSIEGSSSINIPKHAIIYADNNRLRQIFKNLINNSIKYKSEKRKLQISIKVILDEKNIKIEYRDNGIGISPQHQKRIFSKFYQVEQNSNLKKEGVGLGLSIIKEIITLHQGKITIESELDKGATFKIVLPKLQAPIIKTTTTTITNQKN